MAASPIVRSWQGGVIPCWTSLFAIILICPVVQAQVQSSTQDAENFAESFIFSDLPSTSDARGCLEKALSSKIAELDQVCKLTTEQKQKLQLVGLGDIHRFFRQIDELKKEIRSGAESIDLGNPSNRLRAFQMMFECRLITGNSLFWKSTPAILNDRQLAKYLPWKEKEGRRNREVAIDWILKSFADDLKLREEDRFQLRSVLLKEIPNCPMQGRYEMDCLIIQIGKLARLEPAKITVAKARVFFVDYAETFLTIEPALRQAGYFPSDDS